MNIWNKVMLGLILFLGIAAFVLSAKSLYINYHCGEKKAKLEEAIVKAEADTVNLMDHEKGLPAKEVMVQKILLDRAEVWSDCVPNSVNADENFAEVEIVLADGSAAMKENDTVFVFDRRPIKEGGKFLGRFYVSETKAKNATLKSVDILTDEEIEDIKSSVEGIALARSSAPTDEEGAEAPSGNASWSLYSKCPFERPDFFEGMTEAELEPYLSPALIAAYAQEGYEARDFGGSLAWYYRNRVEFLESLASAERTKKELTDSLNITNEQQSYLQSEADRINAEIALMKAQGEEVAAAHKTLAERNEKARQLAEALQSNNEKLTEAIKQKQLEALRKSGRVPQESTAQNVRF